MENPINGPDYPVGSSGASELGGTTDRVREVKENVQKAAAKVQSKAERMADEAVTKVDEKRESAAEAIRSAAEAVRVAADALNRVAEGGVQAAYAAGRKLEASADFLHEHDFRGSLGEAGRFVKRHATESLIAAAVVGFLVGRAVRRI